MLDKRINKIKLYFFAISGVVVLLLFVSIVNLRNNPYFTGTYLKSYLTNWKYEFEFAQLHGITLASSYLDGQSTDASTGSSTPTTATSIPVLVYHGILQKSDGSKYNLTIDKFKDQMFALKEAGYNTITADEMLKYMRGEITLPPKSLLLTFDDGRRDTYFNGDPILKTVGFNAVMFDISHFSIDVDGTNYYLSKEELEQMQASGRWDIEAHTYNGHGQIMIDSNGTQAPFFANKMWLPEQNRLETDQEYAERIANDLTTVKLQLENTLKKKVTAFAFPFGDHGQEDTNYPQSNAVLLDHASSLYSLLFYQFGGGVRFSEDYFNPLATSTPAYMIRRMDIDPNWSGDDIVRALDNADAKTLPYADTFGVNNGWLQPWGETVLADNSITLKPTVTDAGAATVLDGTGGWIDYEVHATVSAQNRNGAYIWMRFQDDNNSAACNFGNGFAHIEQIVNGKESVIKGVEDPNIVIPAGNFQITARVQGRHIDCILDGTVTVSTDFLAPSLNQGGIGFKTWNHGNDGNDLTVKNIQVTSLEALKSGSTPLGPATAVKS